MGSVGKKINFGAHQLRPAQSLASAALSTQLTPLPVWESLSRVLPSRDEDKDFWWAVIGRQFATMMHEAGYPVKLQYDYLLFHHFTIVPRMGPRPSPSGHPRYNSFMCDDFSPVEYSWRWDGDRPDVRFCVEPIGPLAGTAVDPFNQAAMKEMLHSLESSHPEIDATLFWKFAPYLEPQESDAGVPPEWGSSIYSGFEFLSSGVGVKAYYMLRSPSRSAAFFNESFTKVMGSIHGTALASYELLRSFLAEDPDGKTLNMILLAIDCVAPKDSRVKVYMRTPRTSFNSVMAIMTLGGRKAVSLAQRQELKELWYTSLGLDDDFSAADELPFNGHYTAGVPFYFDIKPGSMTPEIKGYIPVRHYAKSDAIAADGLCDFLESRGRGEYTSAYQAMLRGFASDEILATRAGVQTFISFSFKRGDGLALSSYLSPQVYSTIQETLGTL
ncbi:aromatic prenyltransferase [Thozetella sp. PMI_491]|nr:aromatic prenyltransferase [Thozetella sp. PMI_491]